MLWKQRVSAKGLGLAREQDWEGRGRKHHKGRRASCPKVGLSHWMKSETKRCRYFLESLTPSGIRSSRRNTRTGRISRRIRFVWRRGAADCFVRPSGTWRAGRRTKVPPPAKPSRSIQG